MSAKNSNTSRSYVYGTWIARTEGKRKMADTEQFVDEMWATGIRLAATQSEHYQHVMDVIRLKIVG